jgi:hypothetical protein
MMNYRRMWKTVFMAHLEELIYDLFNDTDSRSDYIM